MAYVAVMGATEEQAIKSLKNEQVQAVNDQTLDAVLSFLHEHVAIMRYPYRLVLLEAIHKIEKRFGVVNMPRSGARAVEGQNHYSLSRSSIQRAGGEWVVKT